MKAMYFASLVMTYHNNYLILSNLFCGISLHHYTFTILSRLLSPSDLGLLSWDLNIGPWPLAFSFSCIWVSMSCMRRICSRNIDCDRKCFSLCERTVPMPNLNICIWTNYEYIGDWLKNQSVEKKERWTIWQMSKSWCWGLTDERKNK